MTIDEFIKELESKAELEKERAFYDAVKWNCITAYGAYCRKLGSEYLQLAEWLKELKSHREAWGKAKRTVKAYLMLEGFGSEYQDDIENLIEGCRPKEGDCNASAD